MTKPDFNSLNSFSFFKACCIFSLSFILLVISLLDVCIPTTLFLLSKMVFEYVDANLQVETFIEDGTPVKKGDIVLALNRPMLNNQLKIAELKQSDVPAILYQRVGRFSFDKNLNKRYFLYYFQSPLFLKWLGEQLQGVNIPFINKSKLSVPNT